VLARQTLGLCLGRLGDPRVFDLRDPRAYVEVPDGTYPCGDEGKAVEIGAAFWIGRYPVTNSQYRAFVEDDGYRNCEWWSDAGWIWLQQAGVTEPLYWRDRIFDGPNQPVVGLSFFEAEACSAWAGGRLPREQEWEEGAARGTDGYEYPWCGDWEDGICNTEEVGLYVTSPVGLFPRSRQARLELHDLAGNVWEWCCHVVADPEGSQVLRGGSWGDDQDFARWAFRTMCDPDTRANNLGFRVVCSSPIAKR
jgi:formylglycine-generating enzyme required for sulfatase activity